MNISEMIEGFKSNCQGALMPTPQAEKDLTRYIYKLQLEPKNLEKLYWCVKEETKYFPSVWDIMNGLNKLCMIKPSQALEVEWEKVHGEDGSVTVRQKLGRSSRDSCESEGMSFREWWNNHGGRQEVWEQCEGNEAKFRKMQKLLSVIKPEEIEAAQDADGERARRGSGESPVIPPRSQHSKDDHAASQYSEYDDSLDALAAAAVEVEFEDHVSLEDL